MDSGGAGWAPQNWGQPPPVPPQTHWPEPPAPAAPEAPALWRPPVPPQLTPDGRPKSNHYRPRHLSGGGGKRGGGRSGRGALLAVLVVLLLLAGGGLAVLVVTGEEGDDQAATTTVPGPDTPAEIFAAASDQLDAAGGFSYHFVGRWEIEDTLVGGTKVVTEDGTGAVSLPDKARHTVDSSNGSRRMIVAVGTSTWERFSAFPDQIEQRPWAEVDARLGDSGFVPTVVVDWLADGRNHRDGGEDGSGHAIVHGELSPDDVPPGALDVFGPDEETLTSELSLTVDDDLAPLQLVVKATTQSAVVELTLDRIELGGVATIEAPSEDMLDATPFVDEEDISAVQGEETYGLAGVPDGWILAGATVEPDPADAACAAVSEVYVGFGGYDPETGPSDYLYLYMVPMVCEADTSWAEDPTFAAGEHSGQVTETEADGTYGLLEVDDLAVGFDSSLSAADLEIVLATIGPVDLTAEPEVLEGIPSQPA